MGLGEVGSAIHQLYRENEVKALVHDPYKNIVCNDISSIETLNVCIPCTDKEGFVSSVQTMVGPNTTLVIIHSSILMGVVDRIKEMNPDVSVVHSPIRGVHPNLLQGIKTFVKYVGHPNNDLESGYVARAHLASLGLKTELMTCTESILCKLLSTTYYGMCIAFTEQMGQICDQSGADFNKICHWTKTYNKGYTELGKENVVRPILSRIPDGKHIGGHCVIPNAELLKKMFPSINAFDYILQFK